MYGDCEQCGTATELDCYYNAETGEELYLCDRCSETVNDTDGEYNG